MEDVIGRLDLAPEVLAIRQLRPSERDSYVSNGYANLDSLWDAAFSEALRVEALTQWPLADVPEAGPRTPVIESRAPRRQTRVAVGRLLSELHVSLVSVVRGLSGRMLTPTFAAYGYYEVDDEVLLHVDSEDCEMVLLGNPLGSVQSLHLHPELAGLTLEQLGELESDPEWDRGSGLLVSYPPLGLTAFSGQRVPHHRPAHPVGGVSAVAALCYRSLF